MCGSPELHSGKYMPISCQLSLLTDSRSFMRDDCVTVSRYMLTEQLWLSKLCRVLPPSESMKVEEPFTDNTSRWLACILAMVWAELSMCSAQPLSTAVDAQVQLGEGVSNDEHVLCW